MHSFILTPIILLVLSAGLIAGEIHDAINQNDLSQVTALITSNPGLVSGNDSVGQSPLHLACRKEYLQIVDFLLSKGADPNVRDGNGNVPLSYPVRRGNEEMIKKLLAYGANVNITNKGYSPFYFAMYFSTPKIISLMIDKADLTDFKDSNTGRSYLHFAVIKNDKEKVEALLTKMTDVNPVDNDSCTPLYYAERHKEIQITQLLKSKGGIAKGPKLKSNLSEWISKQPQEKEAVFWYLGNCGYAVKTKNHLMIFDYYPTTSANNSNPSLANGCINPSELKILDVTVFVTHQHADHFSPIIFSWKDSIPKLSYVFGFQPEKLNLQEKMGFNGQSYDFMGPWTSKTINGMNIYTIQANDAGVGFVVQVDGVTIFHGGDHAGWNENQKEGFTSQIDSIAMKFSSIDVALLNVTGCHVRDTIALAEGCAYTLTKLSPKIMIPTHVIGTEFLLASFIVKLKPQHPNTLFFSPKVVGDACLFSGAGKQAELEIL